MGRNTCKWVILDKRPGFYTVYYCDHPENKTKVCVQDYCPLEKDKPKENRMTLAERARLYSSNKFK